MVSATSRSGAGSRGIGLERAVGTQQIAEDIAFAQTEITSLVETTQRQIGIERTEQRTSHGGGEIGGTEAAHLQCEFTAWSTRAAFGDEVDHPTHRCGTVQGRCRTLDHIRPFDP